MDKTMMYLAVLFLTTSVNARKLANARNPTAMGWINLKMFVEILLLSIYFNRKLNEPIMMLAGRIQINKVNNANGSLPRLKPMSVSVCVDEAPGSS